MALHRPINFSKECFENLRWANASSPAAAADGFVWANQFSRACCRCSRMGPCHCRAAAALALHRPFIFFIFYFYFKSSYIPRRSNEVQSGHILSNYYSSQKLVRATGQNHLSKHQPYMFVTYYNLPGEDQHTSSTGCSRHGDGVRGKRCGRGQWHGKGNLWGQSSEVDVLMVRSVRCLGGVGSVEKGETTSEYVEGC